VEKKQFPLVAKGVRPELNNENLPLGYFPLLENMRRLGDDSLTPRHGLGTGSPVMAAQTPAHSVRRLNDSSTGSVASVLVTGAGTHLGICSTDLVSHASSDSGFSGDPLSICIHRPTVSPQPWAYVGDRSRMRKINQAGTDKQIGLPAPASPPSAVLVAPSYKVLDEMNDHTLWTAGGTAAGKANHTRVDGATRTITAILYDSGNTGWACVRPNSMENIGEGTRLTMGAAVETVTVEEIRRGSASTTIESIIYETGGPGLCSIHLTTPLEDIDVDSMVLIAGAEYVRVLSVHRTNDGLLSFRCITSGARLNGDSVQAFSSFRAYFTATHAAGAAVAAAGVEFGCTSGVGHISRTVALDLSSIASGVTTRPEDWMHCDIYVDKPELVTEIKFYLDIDVSSNTFDRNYLMHIIRSNDLTPLTKDEQTLVSYRQVRGQREAIDMPNLFDSPLGSTSIDGSKVDLGSTFGTDGAVPTMGDYGIPIITDEEERRQQELEDRQFNSGQNQWSSIKWRMSQFQKIEGRIGADVSRGWKDVAALRVSVICTGNVTVRIDGWWLGGGFGPEIGVVGRRRIYRYRGLDSATGAVSNWSPALMGGLHPKRQKATVSFTQHPSSECDKLEVQIYGGERLGWRYAETIDNAASPSMADTYSDSDLELLGAISEQRNNRYQLWPQIRPPAAAVTCNTAGNLIQLLGFGTIDTNTAPGTNLRINGRNYTLNRIIDNNTLYIDESAGGQFVATFEVPEPLLLAQPLSILAGPFFGFFFGMGDKYNPFRLYYTNGNDPDSTRDNHYTDAENVTLMNMVVMEDMGRAVVFAAEGAFSCEPSFTLANTGGNLFALKLIPDAPGLFAAWACCDAGGEVVWLSKDGIYATNGGSTRCLSDDLRPIFPKGQTLGSTVGSVVAPNMTSGNATKFRLSYADRELRFDYLGIDGNQHTLVNERGPGGEWLGWMVCNYSPGILAHYAEEGENVRGTVACGADGKLYRLAGGQGDAGASFTARLTTPDHNFGDTRAEKVMHEAMLDYDRDGATISVIPGLNHRASTPDGTTTINSGAGRAQQRIDFDSGRGRRAKDISLAIETAVTTQRPKFYLYEFFYTMLVERSLLKARYYEVKEPGVTYARGVWIYAYTAGVDRDAVFEFTKDDGTTSSVAITGINHSELTERFYDFETPQYIIASRVRPTDSDEWEFVNHRIEGEPAPPLSDGPTPWLKDDYIGARYVQGVRFDIDTQNANVDMAVIVDGDAVQTTISAAAHKGPVLANGRSVKVYSFDEPFITHLIRFNPSAACRIWGAEPIWEPEPELAWMWWTQQNDLGGPGYKVLGDGFITVRSTSNIVLEIIADGTTYTPTFYDASTNTSGARRKLRFRCPAIKGKSFIVKVYAATANGRVSVFQKEFQIEFKPFGFEGGWQSINLLGDAHFRHGARV
jgi:hypothetical protein